MPTIVFTVSALMVAFINLILSRKLPSQRLRDSATADWRRAAALAADVADAARYAVAVAAVLAIVPVALSGQLKQVAQGVERVVGEQTGALQEQATSAAATPVSSPFHPVSRVVQQATRERLQADSSQLQETFGLASTSALVLFASAMLLMLILEFAIREWNNRYPTQA